MPTVDARRSILTKLGDVTDGRGLEIGPLSSPLALRSECDVRYADVFDAATLAANYAGDSNVVGTDIPTIDYPLHQDGAVRTLGVAARPGAPYRWAVASHVIEHVPDIIGWLADVADLLDDGAPLLLVVPDGRYTFDAGRPVTSVGQMIQAHRDGDLRPSVRAVYDHFSKVVTCSADQLWSGAAAVAADRMFALDAAQSAIDSMSDGRYIDAHVWIFTPQLFVEQIAELGDIGLVDFYVAEVIPTARRDLEFYARLARIPRGLSPAEVEALRSHGVRHVPDLPLEPVEAELPAPAPEAPDAENDGRVLLSGRERKLLEAKRALFNMLRGRPR